MKQVLCMYKPIGVTGFDVIKEFKQKNPEYMSFKMSVAGRLDPMAEGMIVVLVGDENKKRRDYENAKKTYEFQILLGVLTDSLDILGIVDTTSGSSVLAIPSFLQIKNVVKSFVGGYRQVYPAFSSKPVFGKPLYYWARTNQLSHIMMPSKEVEIFSCDVLMQEFLSKDILHASIISRLQKVQGDFRQDACIKSWEEFFRITPASNFLCVTCSVECSSGTYIRKLAADIGNALGVAAIVNRIIRTKVGTYERYDWGESV